MIPFFEAFFSDLKLNRFRSNQNAAIGHGESVFCLEHPDWSGRG
jgi:hypothetical protein